ncbi:MAG: hypothetical protein IJ234_00610 [Clostridia bacterium]|nr:hypothetical protein [Clostridia bacterium]
MKKFLAFVLTAALVLTAMTAALAESGRPAMGQMPNGNRQAQMGCGPQSVPPQMNGQHTNDRDRSDANGERPELPQDGNAPSDGQLPQFPQDGNAPSDEQLPQFPQDGDTSTDGQLPQRPQGGEMPADGRMNKGIKAQKRIDFDSLLQQGVISRETYDAIEAYLKDRAPVHGQTPKLPQDDRTPADGQTPELPQDGDVPADGQAPELPQDGDAPIDPLLDELVKAEIITAEIADAIEAAIQ